MTYMISGLPLADFTPLFGLDDTALGRRGARRVIADADRGFPCRVSLVDAKRGDSLILLNHVSNDSDGPYRTAHAIFVREGAEEAAWHIGHTPPVFDGRVLSLRGFDAAGDMVAASIAASAEHDRAIRDLFGDPRVHHIDAHNAVRGCFAARIDRYKEAA